MTELIRGRYEPLEVIGSGGQGEVTKALDHQHDRFVALKIYPVGADNERETMLTEARILLSVSPHSSLPLVREDFFIDDGRYVIVMDWIDGENLRNLLENEGTKGLPYHRVIGYLEQVAKALDHLHHHVPPVIHQDVKPSNLIVTDSGDVALVDFGIATWRGPIISSGGSSGFVAPELLSGEPPTPAADVYGLAATAATLLTGSSPQFGTRPRLTDLRRLQLRRAERTLARGLALDPTRRAQSARRWVGGFRSRLRRVARSNLGRASVTALLVLTVTIVHAGFRPRPQEGPTMIAVGKNPTDVALDSARDRAYVSNEDSGTISVIDLQSLRVTRTIRVAGIDGLTVSQKSGTLFALTRSAKASAIQVFDGSSGRSQGLSYLPKLSNANDLSLDEARALLYVDGSPLFVFSTEALAQGGASPLRSLPVSVDGLAADRYTGRVYGCIHYPTTETSWSQDGVDQKWDKKSGQWIVMRGGEITASLTPGPEAGIVLALGATRVLRRIDLRDADCVSAGTNEHSAWITSEDSLGRNGVGTITVLDSTLAVIDEVDMPEGCNVLGEKHTDAFVVECDRAIRAVDATAQVDVLRDPRLASGPSAWDEHSGTLLVATDSPLVTTRRIDRGPAVGTIETVPVRYRPVVQVWRNLSVRSPLPLDSRAIRAPLGVEKPPPWRNQDLANVTRDAFDAETSTPNRACIALGPSFESSSTARSIVIAGLHDRWLNFARAGQLAYTSPSDGASCPHCVDTAFGIAGTGRLPRSLVHEAWRLATKPRPNPGEHRELLGHWSDGSFASLSPPVHTSYTVRGRLQVDPLRTMKTMVDLYLPNACHYFLWSNQGQAQLESLTLRLRVLR